jgi:outer membrane immunogenic protein
MKRVLAAVAALMMTTAAASAADMAVKARPIAPAPVWSWTGFYFGAHVGAGWGTTESTITTAAGAAVLPLSQTSSSGFLGGVQAGGNYQAGWVVFGVQGDIAAADIKGQSPCLILFACHTKTDWLASVTGRIGAVVLDRGLVYAKGGAAWQNSTHAVDLPLLAGLGVGTNITSKEITHFGWTVGLGTEWMITPNWTAFVEYNYYEFDKKNHAFTINPAIPVFGGAVVNADLRNTMSVAKVGANYKFNWGAPLVAKY